MTQNFEQRNPHEIKIPGHLALQENDVLNAISAYNADGIIPDIIITKDGELIEGANALVAAIRLEQKMVMVQVASCNKAQSEFKLIPVELIDIHPLNTSLYGENEDLTELKKAIKLTGRIKPILVTPKLERYTAICGNSCLKVARLLNYSVVQVEVAHFASEFEEIRALLAGNVGREKSIEQKVREGWLWEKIELEESRARMLRGKSNPSKNSSQGATNLMKNSSQGKTKDIVAKKVGLGSGWNYEHASTAVKALDESKDAPPGTEEHEQHQKLKQILSRTRGVDAAYKLVKPEPSPKPRRWIPKQFERVKIISGPHKGKLATVTIVLSLEVMAHIDGAPEKKRDNIAFRHLEQIKESEKVFTSVAEEIAAKQKEMGFGKRKQLFPEAPRNEEPPPDPLPATITNLNATSGDVLVTEVAIALMRLTPEQLNEVMRKASTNWNRGHIEAAYQALNEYRRVAA